jgi:hypothetical protein
MCTARNVVAGLAMVISTGCAQDRHATTSPAGTSLVVAMDENRAAVARMTLMDQAVKQHYPNLATQANSKTVLWFVANANDRVLATRRTDAIPASKSVDEIGRQFPGVSLGTAPDVQITTMYGELAGDNGPVNVVWARVGGKPPIGMRPAVASLVTSYYGTAHSNGQRKNFWFRVTPAGAVVSHGEGILNEPLSGGKGSSVSMYPFAPGELLRDSVRAELIIE